MIIYQNKQDKSGDNKIIQKQNAFAAENFKVRNWVVIYQQTSLISEKSEQAKRAGIFILMISLHKWHFMWES